MRESLRKGRGNSREKGGLLAQGRGGLVGVWEGGRERRGERSFSSKREGERKDGLQFKNERLLFRDWRRRRFLSFFSTE